MKSRNLKAIFASVLTVALLATAVTGFAANVTTTTTYNTGYDKVEVTTTVTEAIPSSEVTYLVESGSDIVYIDQKTVEDDGTVEFEYKIAKGKINNYQTAVTFGTDDTDNKPFEGTGDKDLGIKVLNDVEGDTYTITYDEVAAGNGDTVTANIVPAADYEIVEIEVGDSKFTGVTSVQVGKDDVITVKTQKKFVTPAIQFVQVKDTTDNGYVTVIKVTGAPFEVGVLYNNERYPAITDLDANNMLAVKLVPAAGEDAGFGTPYFLETEAADKLSSGSPLAE